MSRAVRARADDRSSGRPAWLKALAASTAAALLAGLLSVTPTPFDPPAAAVQSPTSCPATAALTNGSFEQPGIAPGNFSNFGEASVPGWETTATDGLIEMWSSGFRDVPSADGTQFAEINATQASTLYQDIATTPGSTLGWSLYHRGRAGVDTMAVLFGPPAGPLVQQRTISDGNTAWGFYSGSYTVPAGQTTTRFAFRATATATADQSVGNFLDGVSFGTSACVISTKSVVNTTQTTTGARVGDVLRYTVNSVNNGGSPANAGQFLDTLPVGASFVPGSIRRITGGVSTAVTDAVGDDGGEYQTANRRVSVVPATNTNVGATTGMSFDVRIDSAAALTTLNNEATFAFTDSVTGNRLTSTSNTVSTPVLAASDLAVTQTLNTALVPGNPTSYTVNVTNNGGQANTGVSVTMARPTALTGVTATFAGGTCTVTATTITCPIGNLAAGATVPIAVSGTVPTNATLGSTYTLSSTVSGTVYDPVSANNTASTSGTIVASAPALALTKSGAVVSPGTGVVGDTVRYSFTLDNTGNVGLTQVAITDPLPTLSPLTYTWPGTAGSLAPGQRVTATATYVLRQADVDSGSVRNTAGAIGTPITGANATATSGQITVPTTAAAPAIVTTKAGALATGATGAVGDRVNYTFAVRNSGNVTLSGVTLADPLVGLSTPVITWPGAVGTLAPGQTATATANYTITQADVNAGFVRNTATGRGTTPAGTVISSPSAQTTVNTVATAPAVTVTKSAAVGGTGAVGNVISYTFTGRNTGNVTLTGVAISDPLPGLGLLSYTWPGPAGTLQPGQTVTATASYTITQADVDAGSVRNTAAITSTTPAGATLGNSSAQVITPTAASAPNATFTKSGSLSAAAAGGTVTYTFVYRNTGNVTLRNVGVVDPLAGLSAISYGTWPSGTAGTLAPGQQVTATATYTVKQSDVDAGSVANSATATASPPTGANLTRTAPATVVIAPAGTLTLTKSSAYSSGAGGVGSVITYSFSFRNTGNVTLSQVSLADPLPGLSTPSVTWPGTPGTLAPNAVATATATYTVKQSDVDAQSVRNTATVSGRTPAGATVSQSASDTRATAVAAPSVVATKSGVIAGGAAGIAGDVVNYTFTARNSGNVTVTGVAIADPLSGLSALSYSWPAAVGTLAPGQTVTATATYTIKQSDVNNGRIDNTATATASYGATPLSSSVAAVTPTATRTPAISTTQTAALANGATGAAGDLVTFTTVLRNAGNVTLTAVGLAGSLPNISAPVYGAWPSGTAGTLQPGQSVTVTRTYTLTQTDVDAGSVSNTATGSGTSPTAVVVTSSDSDTVAVTSAPSLTLTKSGAVTTGAGLAGDTITYTFVARNGGNVTLTGVVITDPLSGLSAVSYGAWPSGTAGRLAPGQQVTATATYTITQSNVDAGRVQNTAGVRGTPPTGPAATASSGPTTVATAAAAPAITTTKTASGGGAAVGGVVTYTFTARNAGNVTLTGVAIADPLPGLSALAYSWPGAAGTLAPGQTVTATATKTVTQADQNTGSVTNRSTATGTPPTGAAVSAQSAIVVTPTAASAPAITVSKSGALAAGSTGAVGDRVDYTFTVRNAGNVTLTSVTLADPLPRLSAITFGAWPDGVAGTLQPGATVTATASYLLSQTDVDAGAVSNTATATGAPPTGATVTGTGPATVSVTAVPSLTITKAGSLATGSTGVAGDTVTFSFVIRNTGNVTLASVSVTDRLVGVTAPAIVWPGTRGVLAPGQTATGTASYVLKQSDVDTGSVRNIADVVGRPPTGAQVSAVSNEAVVATAPAVRQLTTTKQASVSGSGSVGDTVTYVIRTTNTGNQTITGITITDPLPGLSGVSTLFPGAPGTLAPGQAATGTATYIITQADVNAGSIVNRAAAEGVAAGGVPVRGESPQVTTPTVARNPVLATTKSGSLAAGSTGRAGDVVNFAVTLRNAGNVTLTGVSAADSLPGLGALTYGAWPSGTAGTLQPGRQVTATAQYTLTQTDVNGGAVSNTATGTATTPAGATLTTTGSATVPIASAPLVTLGKVASTAGNGSVGNVITYTLTARNAGNVTLTGVAIDDPRATGLTYAWPGAAGILQPGQTVTGTATHTITQADVDAGSVRNTATVSGTPPTGPAATASSGQVVTPTVASAPAISTAKTAVVAGAGGVGNTITYTFVARNAGNVTLTGVSIADLLPRLGAVAYGTWPGATGVLLPGQTVTATATYLIDQADVNRGSVANTATSTGTPPTGANVSGSSPQVVTATAQRSPSILIDQTGALAAGSTGVAGDTVNWSYVLRNDGNVTLTAAAIVNSLPATSAVVFGPWPGATGTLQPGQQVTASATYVLTQADVDAGSVSNTATGSGTPPTGGRASSTDPATVPLPSAPTLTLTKSASTAGPVAVGDVITYTFRAANTGNVTLRGLVVSDPLNGLSAVSYGAFPSGTAGTLAPGQQVTATATYLVTQADVNAGGIRNTASATARPPAGADITVASNAVDVPTVVAAPQILATKTAVVGGAGAVGDTITYTVVARNTGNVTLTGVALEDTLPGISALSYGAWPATAGTLQPGQQITATAGYVIRQADVDAGSISNTATARGTAPGGGVVTDDSDPVVSATAAANPAVVLTQTGALPAGSPGRAGDVVTFSFTLRNAGNQTVTGATIVPALVGATPVVYGAWPSGTVGRLLPGQTVTATTTYTLTQADVDAGSVSDPATATATTLRGTALQSSAPVTVPIVGTATIAVEKSGSLAAGSSGLAGEIVTFAFVIRNTGTVTLDGIVLADSLPGISVPVLSWPGAPGVLSPGQSATATAQYTITQDDVDTGVVLNTATVSATSPADVVVTDSSDEVRVATGAQRGQLVSTIAATRAGTGAVGDVVSYTFTARNTGTVTLDTVRLLPSLAGLSPLVYTWPGEPGELAPAGVVTATATHTITQADVDAGSVANSVYSTGITATAARAPVTSPAVAQTTPTVARNAAVTLSETGALAAGDAGDAGDTVEFVYDLTNSGNVTLTGASITEALNGATAPVFGLFPSGTAGVLRPGDTVRATATYLVLQTDVDAGSVSSVATGRGVPPTGGAATATASATVPLRQLADLDLDLDGALTAGVGAVGSTITYTYTATNNGSVTLRGVAIADPRAGVSPIQYGPFPGAPGVLAPGQSVAATATYVVTQADVDAGSVSNSATAVAVDPAGATVPASAGPIITPVDAPDPALELDIDDAVDGNAGLGDTITYTFTITNTGNTTIENAAVAADLIGLSTVSYGSFPSGVRGTLLPGQSVVATATYEITQADVDEGSVPLTAGATGLAGVSGDAVASDDVSVETPTQPEAPLLTVTDTGVLAAGATGFAGDRVDLTYVVRNDGNVTVSGVAVTDTLSVTNLAYTWPAAVGVLAPGQSVTVTARHLLTQGEVDAGVVRSQVTASGTTPAGATTTGVAADDVEIVASGSLLATKSGVLLAPGIGEVGDLVRYRLEIRNTGNVTLTNGQLLDPLPGLSTPQITWPDPARPGRVGVGETVVGIADYPLTQADVDRGYIDNEATVSAVTPRGVTVTDDSNIVRVATVQATPALTTTKTATGAGGGVGDEIGYTITARNSGNVTLTAVTLADPLDGLSALDYDDWQSGVAGVLAPGDEITATATYTITQADVDAGGVLNTASSRGTPPGAAPEVGDDSPAVRTQTEAAAPTIIATNSGVLTGPVAVGTLVTFTYRLTNDGNVTLSGVGFTSGLPGVSAAIPSWPGAPGVLTPGQSVEATATYALTQQDIDAGSVSNLLTGTGTPPTGAAVSSQAPATVLLTAGPALTVALQASPLAGVRAGDSISYTVQTTNTGNVTLNGLVYNQDLPGILDVVITWPTVPRQLAPGEVSTATFRYLVTQADVDAGRVVDRVGISGLTPGGAPVAASSAPVQTLTQSAAPAIALAVTPTVNGTGSVGDTIRYDYRITNAGNVTLTGVVLADPLPGLGARVLRWPGEPGVLAPGQSATTVGIYPITQADVDRGFVASTPSATGAPPTGPNVSASRPLSVPTAAAAPSATFENAGALAPGADGRAGDTVRFSYRFTNTGNVTLSAVRVVDTLAGAGAPVYLWPAAPGVLAPGETVTATADYVLSQADVDAGSVLSSATGSGSTPAAALVSASADAPVAIAAAASIRTELTGGYVAPGVGRVGDSIRYSIALTNTGNVTLTGVTATNTLAGLVLDPPQWPDASSPGRLGAGETVSIGGAYTLTQADVDRGYVDDVATGSGVSPAGVTTADDSDLVRVTTVAAQPALTTSVSGLASGAGAVGDVITYTIVIRNTGDVTVDGIAMSTVRPGLGAPVFAWPVTPGVLAPGDAVTITAPYVITQADVDAQGVPLTATATGSSARDDAPVTSGPVTATVPTAAARPDIAVSTSGAFAAGATGAAGDVVTWTYRLTNTGNVTLAGVELSEALAGTSALAYDWPGAPGILAPGESVVATATHPLSQAEVDAGAVRSIVTGSGTPPAGTTFSETATSALPVVARPGLLLLKEGTVAGGAVGDVVDYDFTIRNTGNVTLTLVGLLDGLPGVSDPVIAWPGEPGVLAPNQTATATATYTVSQADVDAGEVRNVAVATGKPPVGDTISISSPEAVTTVEPADAAIGLTQSATVAGAGGVGDVVTSTFRLENTGNQTLSGVALTDLLDGRTAPVFTWPGEPGVLAPGQFATATATYSITQQDVDLGRVRSVAVASGAPNRGAGVSDVDTLDTPTTAATRTLDAATSATLAPGATGRAGDRIDLGYSLVNRGNVTITGVVIVDALAGATAPVYTWPGAPGVLLPGQTVTATASYSLTQADVDRGSVTSDIDGSGAAPGGVLVTDDAQGSAIIASAAALVAVETATIVAPGIGAVGDLVRFVLTVSNTGNVTIVNGRLTAALPGSSAPQITWPDPARPGRVGVGESVTGEATYRLTQADVDRGYLENQAAVAGTAPNGSTVTARPAVVRVDTVQAVPEITTTLTGVATGDAGVGDTITYTITSRNSGNVTLTGISASEPLSGAAPVFGPFPTTPGALAPGEQVTSTVTYVITQADVDRGSVTTAATSAGTPPNNAAAVSDASDPLSLTTEPRIPAAVVDGSAAPAPGFTGSAGDRVLLTYRFENTGNTTLTGVAFSDSLPIGPIAYSWPGAPGVLTPGQFVTATATYTLTQADADAGSVTSILTGAGTAPTGAVVGGSDASTVLVTSDPSLSVTLTAQLAVAGENGLGDIIQYRAVVTNTGNQSLVGVQPVRAPQGSTPPQVTWPGAPGRLAPGQSAVIIVNYDISQADVDRGRVDQNAATRGIAPGGVIVTAQAPLVSTPTAAPAPALQVVKNGRIVSGDGGVGSVIEYLIDVTNTGNVTVNLIEVATELEGASEPAVTFPGTTGVLAPGATAQGVSRYVVTQEDVDRGSVTSSASAVGYAPDGSRIEGVSADETVAVASNPPALSVTQSAVLAAGDTGVLGDTVEYTFTLTNDGDVTLTDARLTTTVDGLTAPVFVWPGAPGVLAPGQSATVTASRTITQADVDAGSVRNTATGSALPPTGPRVSVTTLESVVTLADASGGLEVTVDGDLEAGGIGAVGDVIEYTFTITNPGPLEVGGVTLASSLRGISPIAIGPWPGATGVLAAGASVQATARYVITQADVDAGSVRSTATANGTDSRGALVGDTSPLSVEPTVAAAPQLTVQKTQALAPGSTGRVGDAVEYAFTLANDGNVTLSGVVVADGQAGLGPVVYEWPGAPGVLAPGQTATATARYLLTQADVDAGAIASTATAAASTPAGGTVTAAAPGSVTIAAAPGITLEVVNDPRTVVQQGAVVDYRFTISNPGNVTLSGVAVASTLAGLGPISYAWPGEPGVLLPGQTVAATAAYTITQADVDAGRLTNPATASATPLNAAAISASDTDVLEIVKEPGVRLDVVAAVAPGQQGFAGDTVVFTYVITNTGTTTLAQVEVRDSRAGLSPFVYGTWPGTPGTLAPGESVTVTATWVIPADAEGDLLTGTAGVFSVDLDSDEPVVATAASELQLPSRTPGTPTPQPTPAGPAAQAIDRPSRGLAYTGTDVAPIGSAALLLLLSGLVLMVGSRNRRKDHA